MNIDHEGLLKKIEESVHEIRASPCCEIQFDIAELGDGTVISIVISDFNEIDRDIDVLGPYISEGEL